ncbi:MAG: DUF4258 domain-containing protein [Ginsengibacter sp.]
MKINRTAAFIIVLCIIVFAILKYYVQVKKGAYHQEETVQAFDRHGHLVLTKHVKCRMECREVTTQEINEILQEGAINYNKSELDAPRGPRFALEGYSHEHQHLRVIFVHEKQDIIVITCIDLDKDWPCPSCN